MRTLAALIAAAVACADAAHCEDALNYSHPPYQHPFEATLRAAEHGDVPAQVEVGRDYEKALGVEQDFPKAIVWYKKAAQAGNAQAILALALLGQRLNLAVDDERKFAEPWLLNAAVTGLAMAQVAEAKFHALTLTPEEKSSGWKWLERAAAKGDLEAMSILGPKLVGGDDPNQWSRGEQYVSAAEKTYPRTRFYAEYARFLREHHPPEIRTAQVPEELRRAALRMDVEEENGMALGAIMSIAGIFDLRDQAALLEGMRKRLEQTARDGDLQSACNLALLNTGVTLSFDLFALQTQENYKEAFDWYSSAAKRGAPRAQYHLGKLYRDGLGTDANASEAAKWFYKGAMHGYPPAEAALGDLLLNGNGVPADYAAALGWLRPAAAYGNPMAKFDLGSMYLKGLGINQNTGRAIELIYGALFGGWTPAVDWIQQAQSDPALSSQVADPAIAQAPRYVRRVDGAEGGCDEASINSNIEE